MGKSRVSSSVQLTQPHETFWNSHSYEYDMIDVKKVVE